MITILIQEDRNNFNNNKKKMLIFFSDNCYLKSFVFIFYQYTF